MSAVMVRNKQVMVQNYKHEFKKMFGCKVERLIISLSMATLMAT